MNMPAHWLHVVSAPPFASLEDQTERLVRRPSPPATSVRHQRVIVCVFPELAEF